MSIHIVHVVDSKSDAGSLAPWLSGLLVHLTPLDFSGTTIDGAADWAFNSVNAGVVHIHGWGYPLALSVAREARKSRKPFIISPLGALTPGPFKRIGVLGKLGKLLSERPLVRSAHAVTALNELDLNLMRNAGVHSNIALLPYGIDFVPGASSPSDSSKSEGTGSRTLLMLDPLDPQFGCVMLLKAFAELGHLADGWTITLAGEDRGQWRPKLEAAVRRKGGESRIGFQEAATSQARAKLLAQAAVLVAPALHVAPSFSIMQAVRDGVPILATQPLAPPGLDGAVRVCEADRTKLREQLRALLTMSATERAEIAQRARAKAREALDWAALAPQYAELYSAAIRSRGSQTV